MRQPLDIPRRQVDSAMGALEKYNGGGPADVAAGDERIVERGQEEWASVIEYLVYLRHLYAYELACEHAARKQVLDVGGGSGYGTSMIGEVAREATGVEVSPEAVGFCRQKFGTLTTHFEVIPSEFARLPFDDTSFDLVTMFQVLEHVGDPRAYLTEIQRLLRPGSTLLLTTPSGDFRLRSEQNPWNPYHIRAFAYEMLQPLLSGIFSRVSVCGVTARDEAYEIEKKAVQPTAFRAYVHFPFKRLVLRSVGALLPNLSERLRRLRRGWLVRRHVRDGSLALALEKFKVEDYCLEKGKSPRAIDWLAVCSKSGTVPGRAGCGVEVRKPAED